MIEVRAAAARSTPAAIEAVSEHRVRGWPPGEVFGLLGPNGAGKSTTIGMLTTTVRPDGRARARVGGHDVVREPFAVRRIRSVVFQDAGRRPFAHRTAEPRRSTAGLWGVDPGVAAARIEELAGSLGLADLLDRPVGAYSGGERRRLEIARALVSSPVACCSSTSRPSGSIRGSAHELLELVGRLRRRARADRSC